MSDIEERLVRLEENFGHLEVIQSELRNPISVTKTELEKSIQKSNKCTSEQFNRFEEGFENLHSNQKTEAIRLDGLTQMIEALKLRTDEQENRITELEGNRHGPY